MAARILVIDNDRVSQRAIGLTLRQEGYEVTTASDGPEGLKAAEAQHPDLILIDVMLPESDGYELATAIRAKKEARHLPIILIVPGSDVEHRIRGLRAGADDYLTRPVHPQEMVARVKGLLVRFPPRDSSPAAAKPGGRVLGFYGAKGGAGATTIAINTGIALHRELGRRVVLVDARLQFGDVRVFLDLGLHQRSVIDLVTAPSVDADLISKVVVKHDSGLDVLLAPPSPETAELVNSEDMPVIFHQLRSMYDYVLVDMDQGLDEANLQILDAGVTTFVVMTADLPSIKNVQLLLSTMASLGYDQDRVRLILNRANAVTGINLRNVEFALGRPINYKIINDYRRAISALNTGSPFAFSRPESELSRSVADFARIIDDRPKVPAPLARGAKVTPART